MVVEERTTSAPQQPYVIAHIQPLKMEQIECSETSAYYNFNQTPGKYPKEYIHLDSKHGESLKSRINVYVNLLTGPTYVHHAQRGNAKSEHGHHSQDSNNRNCSAPSFPFHFSKPFLIIFRRSIRCECHACFIEIACPEGETGNNDTYTSNILF